MKVAKHYTYDENTKKVNCLLCPHFCKLSEGKTGLCRTRANHLGMLYAENYGKIASINLDPIEKKPLYHFKPSSSILSLGTYGCNMRCAYCQNYSISQEKANTKYLEADKIIDLLNQFPDNIGIAFTYNEPLMWYEYIYDVSRLIKTNGLDYSIVLVTNGYLNPEPLKEILPFIDALNIDLKTFNDQTYKKLCFGTLEPVLNTIKTALDNCHVEVTNLLIPGENDSEEEIEELTSFLGSLSSNIPLHLSRYYPNYKLKKPPTSEAKLLRAKEIAQKYLNYVYIGNLPNIDANTYCHNCGKLLLERKYYQTIVHLKSSVCPNCQEVLPIIL